MEEEFGVSAAAPVMMAGWADGGAEESTTKTVELKDAGASKIAVIKVIREITGLGLKEAKGLADNGGAIKEDCEMAEAEELKAKLVDAGASVDLV
jgi:large subunit ribosomal protein L7/L12